MRELGVRGCEAVIGARSVGKPAAHGEILWREREGIDHRLHVEAGTPDEQRTTAACGDVVDCCTRGCLEPRHRPLLVGIGNVDEVVRHRGALRAVGFAVPMSIPR